MELIGDDELLLLIVHDELKADEVAAADAVLMLEQKEALNADDAAASSGVEGVTQQMETE